MSGAPQHPSVRAGGRSTVDYTRPPVIETLLGVQFSPLHGLTLPYIGLFWGRVRDRYPKQEVMPPLAPIVEEFTKPPPPTAIGIQLMSEPDARCWFIDAPSTQLIQIQRDRFIRNWRKGESPHDEYPRYDRLRPLFEYDWNVFLEFLESEELGRPQVNQCEVTYINHISLGSELRALGDAHEVLNLLGAAPHRSFLPEPEMLSVNARYLMPERRGRLHIAAQPAIRRQDGQQVLQLSLTARGAPASSRWTDLAARFDEGHDWIVRGFDEITSEKMHNIWGRR